MPPSGSGSLVKSAAAFSREDNPMPWKNNTDKDRKHDHKHIAHIANAVGQVSQHPQTRVRESDSDKPTIAVLGRLAIPFTRYRRDQGMHRRVLRREFLPAMAIDRL